jgi:hypothetical protein
MKQICMLTAALLCAAMMWAETQVQAGCGEKVTITATPEKGWHFDHWSDGDKNATRQVNVTSDATYKAFFAINQYTITFKDGDGQVMQTATYNHGDAVTAPATTPTKTSTVQYEYVFDHWSPNINYTAEEDVVYNAEFTSKTRQYTVTFKNWDGTVLQETKEDYGTLPEYKGAKPSRPDEGGHTFVFSGWDHSISLVAGDVIYTAQYDQNTESFVLTTAGENGTTTGDGTYQYGTEVQITATPNSCYHFVQWNDGNEEASRTITITGTTHMVATFELNTYTIEVVSDDETQGKVSVSKEKE